MKAGMLEEYILKQPLKTIKMKKMKITLLTILLALFVQASFAQTLIESSDATAGDVDGNAVLELRSNSKALLLPRIPKATMDGMTSPVNGLMTVTSDQDDNYILFYFDGNLHADSWYRLLASYDGLSSLSDVRRDESPTFESSYYIGASAGPVTDNAMNNLVIGFEAGKNMAKSADDMKNNTVIGARSAEYLISGSFNTFIGNNSGPADGSGGAFNYSTAVGVDLETSGNYSTALGADARAIGTESIAIGHSEALASHAISIGGTAKAEDASAIAIGHGAEAPTAGSVAIGHNAIVTNQSFSNATAIGTDSRADGEYATALGYGAKVYNANSTAIGYNAITNSDNQIMLGSAEKIFMPGLYNNSSDALEDQDHHAVYIDSSGELRKGPELTATFGDVLKLTPRTSPPNSPLEGYIYYNSDNKKVWVYTGTGGWVSLN
jgi:hypothetical protein